LIEASGRSHTLHHPLLQAPITRCFRHRARAACASFSLAARVSRVDPAALRLDGLGLSGVVGPADASYRLELGENKT
jgi:hypothetical protein